MLLKILLAGICVSLNGYNCCDWLYGKSSGQEVSGQAATEQELLASIHEVEEQVGVWPCPELLLTPKAAETVRKRSIPSQCQCIRTFAPPDADDEVVRKDFDRRYTLDFFIFNDERMHYTIDKGKMAVMCTFEPILLVWKDSASTCQNIILRANQEGFLDQIGVASDLSEEWKCYIENKEFESLLQGKDEGNGCWYFKFNKKFICKNSSGEYFSDLDEGTFRLETLELNVIKRGGKKFLRASAFK